jgi:hypothetical protein
MHISSLEQLLVVDQPPYCTLPLQSPEKPEQYWVTVRDCTSLPQELEEHCSSDQLLHASLFG